MSSMKFKIKQLAKMLCQHVIFPMVYNIHRFRNVDSKRIILADAHHENCPPHMKPVRDALLGLEFNVQEFFFDLDKLSSFKGLKKMVSFMKLYAESGYVVICDNFLPVASCRKRKETKVIQLWHGCGAFKRFGYDAKDDVPDGYRGNVYKNYDIVIVSGEKCVPYFKSAMRCKKDVVKAVGCCITDRFFDSDYLEKCREKFRNMHPEASGKKVVLWAPTFRGNAGNTENKKNAEIVGEAYIDLLAEKYRDELYVIKCYHNVMGRLKKQAEGNTIYETSMYEKSVYKNAQGINSIDMLACADVLITDYSSVFFEYLLLDRPMVFFAPDYCKYAKERGFYLDYDKLPGKIVRNDKYDIITQLYNAVCQNVDAFKDEREEFRLKYMSSCDGHSVERILDLIK